MTFVLILMLSLSTLVQLENRSAATSKQMSSARQNALLGLAEAIGELQRHAGPDQRATATAELLDDDASAALPAFRKWTGVWDTSNYDLRDGNFANDTKPSPHWLVSFPGTDVQQAAFGPTALPGGELIELVSDSRGQRVEVPFVTTGDNDSGYAWWVGDEGVKARIYPDRNLGYVNEPNAELILPARSGYALAETETDDRIFTPDNAILSNRDLHSREGLLQATDSTQWANVADLYHDVTVYSRGLLTDVRNGGLRHDLTTALANAGTEPLGPIFTDAVGDDFMGGYGPDWEVLRSFWQLRADTDDGEVDIRGHQSNLWPGELYHHPGRGGQHTPPNRIQHGVAPIITSFQLYFYAHLFDTGQRTTNGKIEYGCRVYYLPRITLWNPYNVTLKAPDNLTFVFSSDSQLRIVVDLLEVDKTNPVELNETSNKDAIENVRTGIFTGMRSFGKWNILESDDLRLELNVPSAGIPPGEAMTFGRSLHIGRPAGDGSVRLNATNFGNGAGIFEDSSNTLVLASDPGANTHDYHLNLRLRAFRNLTGTDGSTRTPNDTDANDRNYDQCTFRLYAGDDSNENNLLSYVHFISFGPRPGFEGTWGTSFAKGLIDMAVVNTNADDADSFDLFSFGLAFGIETALQFPRVGALEKGEISITVPSVSPDFRERNRIYADYNLRAPRMVKSNSIDGVDESPGGAKAYLGYLHFEEAAINEAYPIDFSRLLGPGDFDGSNRMILFELPSTLTPFHSIGQLAHVNLSDTLWAPNYQVGNSHPSPMLSPSELFHTRSENERFQGGKRQVPTADWPYLANDALWDRYFFSTRTAPGVPELVRHPHYLHTREAEEDPSLLDDPREAAAHLAVEGTFNINSTSEEAWKILLGSFYAENQNVDIASGEQQVNDLSPVLRFRQPLAGIYDDYADNENALPVDETLYAGYRALTNDEIETLAGNIVDEVKKRGPFLSLAEFVNRQYEPNPANSQVDPTSDADMLELADITELMGPVQAAIEKSGLNARLLQGESYVVPDETNKMFNRNNAYPPNRAAAAGSVLKDAPGYFSQVDIFARLGSLLSARSDVFVVRSYGRAKDRFGNEIEGEAWLEAIVERTIVPVQVANPATPYDPADPQQFGRKFRIVALRWLEASEV